MWTHRHLAVVNGTTHVLVGHLVLDVATKLNELPLTYINLTK